MKIRIIAAVMLSLIGASTAFAIPAKRVFRTIVQPDGSIVKAMPVGDEYAHYYIDEDGTPMDFDTEGTLRYIKADASGDILFSPMAATGASARTTEAKEFVRNISTQNLENVIAMRSAKARISRIQSQPQVKATTKAPANGVPQYGMGLFTSNYPRTGDVRSLVFLVEYQDVKFRVPDAHRFFDDMLNKEGFNEYNGTGSARDYFLEQSHGNFRPHFDVYGPVTLPNKMAYYGENRYGQDLRPEEMVLHAAEILKDQIDFSIYDYDNNGQVDNIYIIYAGLGENSGGHSTSVWPHSYQINNGPEYNGKKIYAYACSNEITDGKPDGIGTFCHEYSHVLGLPDLYGTQYTLSCTPKSWSVMDYGPYNNDSRTPPNYSVFERNALGWIQPLVADGPESVELDAIHVSNRAYLIQTQNTNEFFLIENRQQDGWDKYIPGHGMLLWHIDFDQLKWDQNIVNNNRYHQHVDIVEAIGRTGESSITLAGYSFPGTTGKTSITRDTNPALADWNGTGIDMPITDITENEGLITFNLLGGAIEIAAPAKPELSAGNIGDVHATWETVEGATSYLVTFYTRDIDSNIAIVRDYKDYNVGNVLEYTFDSLQGNTEYFCTVRACIGRNISDPSEETSITTPKIDFIYTAPNAISCERSGDNAILTWEALEGAEKYLVTAEYEELADDIRTKIAFGEATDTEITVPEGWQWSEGAEHGYFSISTGFFGEAAPALKFENNNATLTSPEIELDIKNISFWLRGASVAAAAKLDLQGRYSEKDNWRSLTLFNALNVYNSRGKTLDATIPTGIHQLRFVYTSTKGAIAFDDLTITTSGYVYLPLAESADAGTALNYTVEIPSSATGIRFSVVGLDSEGRRSRPSNQVFVRLETNGINDAIASTKTISANGRTVLYSGTPGDIVTVYTLSGAVAAKTQAGTDGHAEMELPAGFYIVTTPQGSIKINLK